MEISSRKYSYRPHQSYVLSVVTLNQQTTNFILLAIYKSNRFRLPHLHTIRTNRSLRFHSRQRRRFADGSQSPFDSSGRHQQQRQRSHETGNGSGTRRRQLRRRHHSLFLRPAARSLEDRGHGSVGDSWRKLVCTFCKFKSCRKRDVIITTSLLDF